MSEHSASSLQEPDQSKVRQRKTKIIAAVTAVAAASLITYANTAGNDSAPAPPQATEQPGNLPETGMSPEQNVQNILRNDAAAVVRAAGSLLEASGGQSVYSGAQFDNYGENDSPAPDQPGIKIVKNPAQSTLTVELTNDTDGGYTLQAYVSAADSLMANPLTAETIVAGPSPANMEVLSAVAINNGTYAQLASEQAGHLVSGNGMKLSVEDAHANGLVALQALEQVAAGLHTELPAGSIDELTS